MTRRRKRKTNFSFQPPPLPRPCSVGSGWDGPGSGRGGRQTCDPEAISQERRGYGAAAHMHSASSSLLLRLFVNSVPPTYPCVSHKGVGALCHPADAVGAEAVPRPNRAATTTPPPPPPLPPTVCPQKPSAALLRRDGCPVLPQPLWRVRHIDLVEFGCQHKVV